MTEATIDLPEMPAAFRELAEQGVAQAKESYEKLQAAADELAAVLEQTYATAATGVADYHLKLIDPGSPGPSIQRNAASMCGHSARSVSMSPVRST
jgi:hypothetical protein